MTLAQYIAAAQLDPIHAMDYLQNFGIISDNCITVADVVKADHARSIAVLKELAQ